METKILRKKLIASMLTIMLLLNVIIPYANVSLAATAEKPDEPCVILRKSDNIKTSGSNRYFTVDIVLTSYDKECFYTNVDINLKYDPTKVKLCRRSGSTSTKFTAATTISQALQIGDGAYEANYGDTMTYVNTTENWFRLYLTNIRPESPNWYDGELTIATLYFRVEDANLTDDNIETTELFTPNMKGLTGGKQGYVEIDYGPEPPEEGASESELNQYLKDIVYDINANYLGLEGLAPIGGNTATVSSIAVKTNPTNTTYNHGDTVELTGGIITVTYDDGTTKDVSMTDSKVSIKSGSPADVDNPKVTIEYEGQKATFDITVNDPVQSLTVTSPMTNKNYNQGDNFNFDGLQLKALTKSGKTIPLDKDSQGLTISETSADIKSSEFTQVSAQGVLPVSGTQKIIFTYEGKTANETVAVNDVIKGIKVTKQPDKKVYKRGESLDLTGATVEITLGSGKTSIDLPDGSIEVTGYNKNLTGSVQNLSVAMGSISANEKIKVEAYNYVTGSTLVAPNDLAPTYDTELDLTGSKLKLNWHDTTTTNVNVTSAMIKNYNKKTIGVQTVTVEYDVVYTLSDPTLSNTTLSDKITKTFLVEVVNSVQSIAITPPTKKTYNHGENLDYTGGKIEVTYANSNTSELGLGDATITESNGDPLNMSPASYDDTNKVEKTLKISYTEDGKTGTANYPITIINDVKSISMNKTPKVNYNVNDTIELSNGEILVTRAVGNPKTVSLEDSRVKITGFNSEAEHVNLPIKVEFTENGVTKETSYNVNVTDSVKSIDVQGAPTTIKYGEELNLTGVTIDIVKGSGNSSTAVTSSMISNFNKNQLGEQEVTVTYGGQTDTFKVTVQDYVTGITVAPATVSGIYNALLSDILTDNNVKYTVTYAAAGAQTPVDVTASMVSGYSATSTKGQNLTVTYKDTDANSYTNGKSFTGNLTITLSNVVTGITITAPTKTTYNHGESLSLTGGVINLTYADGITGTEPITSATIKESDGSTVNMSPASYDATNKVSKTLKITYTKDGETGSVDYPITIINDIQSISVHATPKTQYNVNDPIDLTNGEIKVKRAVGTDSIISMSDSKVSVTGFNSSAEKTSLPLTVSYTENGVTKETSYNINVTDSVKSIDVQGAPTTVKYGEELNLSGITIDIEKGSGNSSTAVTSAMISNFNKNQLGEQEVTVTYGGQTDTFTVTVQDYVTGITVNPATVTGSYNALLSDILSDNSVKYTVTYAAAGAQTPVDVTDSMVLGYSATSTKGQNLTVTYKDTNANSYTNGKSFTENLTVTLSNAVTGITITAPTKTTYNHGESLSLTGGVINLTYADGTTGTEPITSTTIKESDGSAVNMSPASYDGTNKVSKTLKITYTKDGETGSVDYPITIINDIQSISVHATPKTQYNVNDPIDLTNGEIKVKRAVGTDSIISMSDSKVSVTGFNSSAENTNLPLTVSYTENGITKTTSYNVVVADSVTSIDVQGAPTTVKYGEELDLSGTTIDIVKGSGNTSTAVTSGMISNFNKNQLGEQEVTVTYGGQTDTFTVTVQDYVTGITVNPATVTGSYNALLSDILSDNSVKYTVTYVAAGAQTPVDVTDSMVSGYSATSTKGQNLTVTYKDTNANSYTNGKSFTENLTITLSNVVTGITITVPTKTTYNHGESLSLTGGVINLTYADGTTGTEPITSATIKESDGSAVNMSPASYDGTNKVEKTLKITYTKDGETGNVDYPITIINDIQSISVHVTPKTQYNVNDPIDLTNGEIKVKRAVGTDSIISMSDSKVSVTGFNSSAESTNLPLTVSYTENGITKGTSYNINVTDNVESIKMGTTPKTNYKYDEELDITTGTIEVKKGSTTTTIPITSDMVSGYDKHTLGEQTITITYGGQTATYQVTVSDYIKDIIVIPPTKVKYEYGEGLDLDGGSVQKVMASGAQTSPVALSDNSVQLSTFNPNKEGKQTIKVTYEGLTEGFDVTVEDSVQSITIQTPTKTQYQYGDPLSVTGGKITETKTSGKTKIIDITTSMIKGYNPNQLGDQELTVTYKGKTETYTINVEDYIKDISLVRPNKLIYKIGDSIDLTGGKVNLIMASGTIVSSIDMDSSDVVVTGFESVSEGAKLIKVTYKGFTKTFGITVADELSGMIIKTLPKKLDYRYGEGLSLAGGTIEIERESGAKKVINMSEAVVSGYNAKQLGSQTLTVTYQGFTQNFIVNVEDYVSKLEVQAPSKVEYEYGEDLDLDEGKISVVMASGKIGETVKMTASMVSGFNAKQEGKQTIKVEYKGLQGDFQVNVIDKIKGISIKSEPNKKEYKYAENLDLTGGTITVVKSSGTTIIPITQDMVSGYNATTTGTQVVTISYGGFTTKFVVKVKEPEKQVEKSENVKPGKKTNVKTQTIVVQAPVIEQTPEQPEEAPVEMTPIEKPQEKETKPTETLGVKDEKDDSVDPKIVAGAIGGMGILLLFLLAFFKRNTKIYVEEDGEMVLGGVDKIKRNNPQLNVDQYLDGETYHNRVKIVLNKSISKILDGKVLKIKHRGEIVKYKINYKDEPYEIILQ